ncbi:unnamed protein product [Urochloa humidicola]
MPAAAARNNSAGMPAAAAAGKKPRKPYEITRPRERWAVDEHHRFLHALMLFGRDWKRIEQFVATKTATQIRSHAQKYFLKAQKLGFGAALPPPHPRRGAVLAAHARRTSQSNPPEVNAVSGTARAQMGPTAATPPPTSWPSRSGGPGEPSWVAGAMPAQEDETIQLPLPPDDPRFAQVYRFVGDVFGSGAAARPVEEQLRRLQGMDPAVVDTILLVLRNLQDKLFV